MYKLKGKLIYLVAKFGGHITAHLPSVQVVVRFKTKQSPVWSKALIMPLTNGIMFSLTSLTSSQVIFLGKNGFYISEFTLTTEFSGSNFLHLPFQ